MGLFNKKNTLIILLAAVFFLMVFMGYNTLQKRRTVSRTVAPIPVQNAPVSPQPQN